MKEYRLRKQPTESELKRLVEIVHDQVLARLLWHRNLRTAEAITSFNSLTELLPTNELYDLESFYKVLDSHKEKESQIVIYGDYDADGAVAAAILYRFLAQVLKLKVTVYIPDRHEEGYGLNKAALLTLADKGTGLVITVDCGVRDSLLIKEVMNLTTMEIAVTDHHQPGDTFPTCATVHPLYPNHESQNKYTSGGVVAWKVVRFLEDKYKLSHEFSESVVDLAGTSLVTDIMPLLGENRVILKRAIQKMRQNPVIGLRVLAEIAQVPMSELSTYHLGYVIGPRLNASGRIGDPYTSTRLLCTDNERKAREYAQLTNEINQKRQEITKDMFDDAEKKKQILAEKLLVVASPNWDDGIIGLVAGKLMNLHNYPSIAISIDVNKDIAKGSARSFGTFDITQFLSKLSSLLERYGGHQNAAGFSMKGTSVQAFLTKSEELLISDYHDYLPIMKAYVDSYLEAENLTEKFFESLATLEPFGQANATPLFAVKGKVSQFSTFGQQGNHVRIELQSSTGVVKGLAFDAMRLLAEIEQGKEVILIGKPKLDEYMGRKQIQFFIDDIVAVLPESDE